MVKNKRQGKLTRSRMNDKRRKYIFESARQVPISRDAVLQQQHTIGHRDADNTRSQTSISVRRTSSTPVWFLRACNENATLSCLRCHATNKTIQIATRNDPQIAIITALTVTRNKGATNREQNRRARRVQEQLTKTKHQQPTMNMQRKL